MAIKKPVPKELVIKDLGVLFITAKSDDARQWIETEAPEYGNLTLPGTVRGVESEYMLAISQAYDRDEVIAYLNSYNDEVSK